MPEPSIEAPVNQADGAVAAHEESGSPPAWFALLCWLVLAAVLARVGTVVAWQLAAPFDLVYESPNLSTIEVVRAGGNPYSPAVYDDAPFVFTVYTPLYHVLVAALPASRENPFLSGRLVALACMLASAGLLFALPRPVTGQPSARPQASWAARVVTSLRSASWAALAAACFLALWPVTSNAAFLKNDSLALVCAAGAVVLIARGTGKRTASHLWAPALLCVLSAAAKQSYVAAPLACALQLLIADRRRGLAFVTWLALFGTLFALTATALWGSGFWFCTVTAVHHPMSLQTARAVLAELARQPLASVLAGATLLALGVQLRRPGHDVAPSLLAFYVLCAALSFAATIGKQGSSTNYVFELALAAAMFLAVSGAAALCGRHEGTAGGAHRAHRGAALVTGLALLAACSADLFVASGRDVSFADPETASYRVALADELRTRCLRLAGPDAVILDVFGFQHTFEWLSGERLAGERPPGGGSPRTDSLWRAGFLNDPWLYSILWGQGTLSPTPLVAALKRGAADLVLLPAELDPTRPLGGPTGAVLAAVARHYRLAETGAGFAFWVRPKR